MKRPMNIVARLSIVVVSGGGGIYVACMVCICVANSVYVLCCIYMCVCVCVHTHVCPPSLLPHIFPVLLTGPCDLL